MNKEKIEKLWREILLEIGENPDRPGLKETPKRIAKMYEEIYRGYDETNRPKVTTFDNGNDGLVYDQMITEEGNFYSHCEHHNATFFGTYYFAYIPSKKGKILGLSKVARIVDFYSAKMQIQERLVTDIVNCLWKELSKNTKYPPRGMALIMKGKHMCKSMRGAKKDGWMTTSIMKGIFDKEPKAREEFLKLIELKGGNN